MSISNRHTVVPFKAGESKPLDGQVLLRAMFQERSKEKLPSVCVSAPDISVDALRAKINALLPAVMDIVHKAREQIVKEKYLQEAKMGFSISDEDLSLDAAIAKIAEESERAGRVLTKESMENFFGEHLEDLLRSFLAAKLDKSEDDARVAANVIAYKTVFSGLAGNKLIWNANAQKAFDNLTMLIADEPCANEAVWIAACNKMVKAKAEFDKAQEEDFSMVL